MPKCNLCGSANLLPLIHFGSHPISHHYLKNNQQDLDTYDIDLQFCEECGLTQIVTPVPPEKFYTHLFALSSWKNQPHIQHEIDLISQLAGLSEQSLIVEIASNDGLFSRALMDRGYHHVIGIEPAEDAQNVARKRGVKTIGAFFNLVTAQNFVKEYGQAKLVIARQVLEHIANLQDFQTALNHILMPGGYLLLEVPDFLSNLKNLDYSLWEEHVNQFTIDTLRTFTSEIGLNADHIETIIYSGESIILLGSRTGEKTTRQNSNLPILRQKNIHYKNSWPEFRTSLIEYLSTHKKQGGKIAIYGAGGRACALVNYTGMGPYIECFVDDQPEKQGLFMPGSRLQIRPATALYTEGIDLCLLAVNTENEAPVMEKHKKWQENGGVFFSIFPPSNCLLPPWEKFIKPSDFD